MPIECNHIKIETIIECMAITTTRIYVLCNFAEDAKNFLHMKIPCMAYSILLAQLIATLIHYPCTVALTALADWSALIFYRDSFANHMHVKS